LVEKSGEDRAGVGIVIGYPTVDITTYIQLTRGYVFLYEMSIYKETDVEASSVNDFAYTGTWPLDRKLTSGRYSWGASTYTLYRFRDKQFPQFPWMMDELWYEQRV